MSNTKINISNLRSSKTSYIYLFIAFYLILFFLEAEILHVRQRCVHRSDPFSFIRLGKPFTREARWKLVWVTEKIQGDCVFLLHLPQCSWAGGSRDPTCTQQQCRHFPCTQHWVAARQGFRSNICTVQQWFTRTQAREFSASPELLS